MQALSYADHLRGNFRLFIRHVWKFVLHLPPPTRVQDDIALFLETGANLRAVEGYRGVGKSFLTCAKVVWDLWNDPQHRIVIVSATASAAEKNANLIKQIIHHDSGDDLWADLRPREGQKTSVKAFDVGPALPDRQPSVSCVGIGGQLPNNRATILIADDVEIPNNSMTEDMRDKLRLATSEFTKIIKPGCQIIYLGTPQSQESIYADLPDRGYEVRVWPARYPLASKVANYGETLAPMLRLEIEANPALCVSPHSKLGGQPTDPARFDDVALRVSEMDATAGNWMLHMMLDTALSDEERYPLKTRDLIVMDVDKDRAPVAMAYASDTEKQITDLVSPGFTGDRFFKPLNVSEHWAPYTGAVMHVDPSGQGADETGYVVTKYLEGRIFILEWGGLQDGLSEETHTFLAERARHFEVKEVIFEDNFGDTTPRLLMTPVLHRKFTQTWRCGISGFKVKGQKEKRIVGSIEPALKQHRIVMAKDVIRAQEKAGTAQNGLYQMTRMTVARGALKHDDRIDVLAMAVEHWKAFMTADVAKSEERAREKARQEFEKRFFDKTPMGRMVEQVRRGIGRPNGRR